MRAWQVSINFGHELVTSVHTPVEWSDKRPSDEEFRSSFSMTQLSAARLLAFVRARAPHLRCLRLQNSEGYWSGARRLAVCEGDYPGTTSSQAKSSYSDSSHSKSLLQR